MTDPGSGDMLRIGARFPNAGDTPSRVGLAEAARTLEAAGFDSLWASDHLAMPASSRARYPFSDDGRFPWPLDLGWSDAVVSLWIAAAVTSRIELGTAVLVAPLRPPLLTGIQMASVSVEASGRCVLGIGAGWLAEEFDAMGVSFTDRGRRMDAWIETIRAVWDGALPERPQGGFYPNPTEMVCRPVPVEPIPILVGGMGRAALRRAGRLGDGWLALQALDALDDEVLRAAVATIRDHADDAGRRPGAIRITLQVTASTGRAADLAVWIPRLRAAGVHEVIIDVDWEGGDDPREELERLRAAA